MIQNPFLTIYFTLRDNGEWEFFKALIIPDDRTLRNIVIFFSFYAMFYNIKMLYNDLNSNSVFTF